MGHPRGAQRNRFGAVPSDGPRGDDPQPEDDRLVLLVVPVPALDTKLDADLAEDEYLVNVARATLRMLTAIFIVRLLMAILDLASVVGLSGASMSYAFGLAFGLVHIWFSLGLTGLECYVGNVGVEERDGPALLSLTFLAWLPLLLFADTCVTAWVFFEAGGARYDGGGGTWATVQWVVSILILLTLVFAFIGAVLLKLAFQSALGRIPTGQGV